LVEKPVHFRSRQDNRQALFPFGPDGLANVFD
jgi:hypothetical protein